MTDPSKLFQKQGTHQSPAELDDKILSAARAQAETNTENQKSAGANWITNLGHPWMPTAATAAVLLIGVTFAFNFDGFVSEGEITSEFSDSLSSPVPFDVVEIQTDFDTEIVQFEEIVVTGRKREESLTDIPVSVSPAASVEIVGELAPFGENDLFELVSGLSSTEEAASVNTAQITEHPAASITAAPKPLISPATSDEIAVATLSPEIEENVVDEPVMEEPAIEEQIEVAKTVLADEEAVVTIAGGPESAIQLDEVVLLARHRQESIEEEPPAETATPNEDIQLEEIIVTGRRKEGFFGIGRAFSRLFSREETVPDLIEIRTQIPDVILDIQYAGADNFVGEPIDGYSAPKALLSDPALEALANVQEALREQGLGLKIFDAYRPQQAVDHFIRWSKNGDESTKVTYYPNIDKQDLFGAGYLAERSSHSRGSTVDVTIVKLNEGGAPEELDMGTIFDFFDPTSWPNSTDVNETAQQNRRLLQEIMVKHGFEPFETEWWHFTLKNELYPNQYFDLPID